MPLKNGLYKVEFRTPLGAGAGVVMLKDGMLHGGDAGLYYVGSYSEKDGQFTAQVQTDRHTDWTNMQSVFGVDRVTISLKGNANDNSATMTGTAKEAPGVSFQAHLSRLAS